MEEKKKLSVSIVSYKNYNDIKELISTMETFTSETISKKIYIVDNASSLCDKSVVEKFKKSISKFKDVEYIDAKKNLGFGKGHNYVLRKIDSEYHAIVNPDIVFSEDAFLSIINYMDNNKDVGMVIPNIIGQDGKRQWVYRKELTVWDMFIRMFCKGLFKKRVREHALQDKDYSKPFQVPFGQGSFLVIRTELFKKLNGFDDNFFMYVEDADLCKRVNNESKLMYCPYATVVHKWEQGSHKSKVLFKYHMKSMYYYYKKWGWKFF